MMKAYVFALVMLLALATSTSAHAGEDVPWRNEEIGAIPLVYGMDENGNPDEATVLILQKWRGVPIMMGVGGVDLSENYATCSPGLRDADPQSQMKGNLSSRMRGSSGGNVINFNNCMIIKR